MLSESAVFRWCEFYVGVLANLYLVSSSCMFGLLVLCHYSAANGAGLLCWWWYVDGFTWLLGIGIHLGEVLSLNIRSPCMFVVLSSWFALRIVGLLMRQMLLCLLGCSSHSLATLLFCRCDLGAGVIPGPLLGYLNWWHIPAPLTEMVLVCWSSLWVKTAPECCWWVFANVWSPAAMDAYCGACLGEALSPNVPPCYHIAALIGALPVWVRFSPHDQPIRLFVPYWFFCNTWDVAFAQLGHCDLGSSLLGLLVGMLEWIVYSDTFVLVCAALVTCALWACRSWCYG
jgi:hypothetical protein